MEEVTKKYKGKAEFWFVYCREAHPDGDPRVKTRTKKGQPIKQALTPAERQETAQQFCSDMRITRRILVDEFGPDCVQRLYGGLPNPTVVIDLDGKMALKMAWTNGKALDDFLHKFLAGGGRVNLELARNIPVRGPGGGPGEGGPGPGIMAKNIERMLEGIDLTEAEGKAARSILLSKMQARGKLRMQALALDELTRNKNASEADVGRAAKAFEAAVAQLKTQMEALDRELSNQLSTRARAQLLAAGILENGLGFMGPPRPNIAPK